MAEPGDVTLVMFGAALRAQRTLAKMSLRDLGRRIHYDHSRLSRAENGEHLPALRYVRSMDAVFGTGDLLTTLHSLVEQAHNRRTALAPKFVLPEGDDVLTTTVEVQMPDGRIMRVSIPRRQFGELLAASGISLMFSGSTFNGDEIDQLRHALSRPRDVDERVAGYFLRQLTEHYAADKMLGPAELVPVARAQMATLDRLRRAAQPRVRSLLTPVQCQYAEFLGWLHQDAGDTDSAMRYSDQATELALISGNKNMIAYMLIRKSNIAYRAGDAVRATDLAAAAQHDHDGVDRTILALASQQEARGWAIIGNYDRTAARLDQAADLLRATDSEPDPGAPAYIHHYDLDTLEDQAATCYRDVGRTDQAIAIFQRKIDQLPAGYDRDRGYRMAKLAVAYSHAHQAQEAASLGLQALTLARQTGSARTETELQPLATALAPWRSQPDVATLLEALHPQGSL
jgi:transcriptional regulator with XRE-family HTH domain